jgi:hypothetical protein
MKRTFVYMDGEFIERKKDAKGRYHYVIPDIQPYKSMIDGRMITSRSEHRAHLRANGCIEVGNEDPSKHIRRDREQNSRLDRIRHEVNQRFTNAQADKALAKLRDDLRFTNFPHRRG